MVRLKEQSGGQLSLWLLSTKQQPGPGLFVCGIAAP